MGEEKSQQSAFTEVSKMETVLTVSEKSSEPGNKGINLLLLFLILRRDGAAIVLAYEKFSANETVHVSALACSARSVPVESHQL